MRVKGNWISCAYAVYVTVGIISPRWTQPDNCFCPRSHIQLNSRASLLLLMPRVPMTYRRPLHLDSIVSPSPPLCRSCICRGTLCTRRKRCGIAVTINEFRAIASTNLSYHATWRLLSVAEPWPNEKSTLVNFCKLMLREPGRERGSGADRGRRVKKPHARRVSGTDLHACIYAHCREAVTCRSRGSNNRISGSQRPLEAHRWRCKVDEGGRGLARETRHENRSDGIYGAVPAEAIKTFDETREDTRGQKTRPTERARTRRKGRASRSIQLLSVRARIPPAHYRDPSPISPFRRFYNSCIAAGAFENSKINLDTYCVRWFFCI